MSGTNVLIKITFHLGHVYIVNLNLNTDSEF